jgi:hypothetical protein
MYTLDDSMESIYLKRHDNSLAEQESVFNQLKSHLMKLHFQQEVQGDHNEESNNDVEQSLRSQIAESLRESHQMISD